MSHRYPETERRSRGETGDNWLHTHDVPPPTRPSGQGREGRDDRHRQVPRLSIGTSATNREGGENPSSVFGVFRAT